MAKHENKINPNPPMSLKKALNLLTAANKIKRDIVRFVCARYGASEGLDNDHAEILFGKKGEIFVALFRRREECRVDYSMTAFDNRFCIAQGSAPRYITYSWEYSVLLSDKDLLELGARYGYHKLTRDKVADILHIKECD